MSKIINENLIEEVNSIEYIFNHEDIFAKLKECIEKSDSFSIMVPYINIELFMELFSEYLGEGRLIIPKQKKEDKEKLDDWKSQYEKIEVVYADFKIHTKLYLFNHGKCITVINGSHNLTNSAIRNGNFEGSTCIEYKKENEITENINKNIKGISFFSKIKKDAEVSKKDVMNFTLNLKDNCDEKKKRFVGYNMIQYSDWNNLLLFHDIAHSEHIENINSSEDYCINIKKLLEYVQNREKLKLSEDEFIKKIQNKYIWVFEKHSTKNIHIYKGKYKLKDKGFDKEIKCIKLEEKN